GARAVCRLRCGRDPLLRENLKAAMTFDEELRQEVSDELADRIAYLLDLDADAEAVQQFERVLRRVLRLGMGPSRSEVYKALMLRIVADVRRIEKQVGQRVMRAHMVAKSREIRAGTASEIWT